VWLVSASVSPLLKCLGGPQPARPTIRERIYLKRFPALLSKFFFGSDTHTYHSQSFVTLVSTYPLNLNSLRNAVLILPNHNNPSLYSSSQIPHNTHIYLPDSLSTQTSLKHPSWRAQHSSYAPASSASSPRNVRLPTPNPQSHTTTT
jgi:hypothetical protein